MPIGIISRPRYGFSFDHKPQIACSIGIQSLGLRAAAVHYVETRLMGVMRAFGLVQMSNKSVGKRPFTSSGLWKTTHVYSPACVALVRRKETCRLLRIIAAPVVKL